METKPSFGDRICASRKQLFKADSARGKQKCQVCVKLSNPIAMAAVTDELESIDTNILWRTDHWIKTRDARQRQRNRRENRRT